MVEIKYDNKGKKGKWITMETSHEWIDDVCSLCGYTTGAFSTLETCPRCGADMRKDEKEGN